MATVIFVLICYVIYGVCTWGEDSAHIGNSLYTSKKRVDEDRGIFTDD
jgi:hypothetical protein